MWRMSLTWNCLLLQGFPGNTGTASSSGDEWFWSCLIHITYNIYILYIFYIIYNIIYIYVIYIYIYIFHMVTFFHYGKHPKVVVVTWILFFTIRTIVAMSNYQRVSSLRPRSSVICSCMLTYDLWLMFTQLYLLYLDDKSGIGIENGSQHHPPNNQCFWSTNETHDWKCCSSFLQKVGEFVLE